MFTGFQTKNTGREMMDVNKFAGLLMPVLPVDWEKVSFCAYVVNGNFEMFYYCFTKGKAEPIRFSDLGKEYRITDEMIDQAFESIESLLSSYRAAQKKQFSSLTLVFDLSMKFSLKLEYEPVTYTNATDYERTWKERNRI